MDVQTHIKDIQKRIQDSAAKAGRIHSDILLLGVTKTAPVETIQKAYDAGLRTFGENRVQEALEKILVLPKDVQWHLIGQLQSNKINKTIGQFTLIQSIDSLKLAEAVSARQDAKQAVLLEVNTSGESTKSGISPEEAVGTAKAIAQLANLELKGLMTVGPLTEDKAKQRDAFKKLKELFETMKIEKWSGDSFATLSMGMSSDFEMAIEEGSTLVRVGSALFGKRT